MAQPVWVTPAGDLGTIAENLFFQVPVLATDPDGGTPTYTLIAGRLPTGIQVTSSGTVEGVPLAYTSVKGTPTEVSENVTSTFAIRATSPDGASINDRTFSLTVTGQDIPQFTTAAGSLGTFYDCDGVNITIGFTDTDPNDVIVIDVDNGELPPGLTINATTGVISGHITPISDLPDNATAGYDASAFDLYPFSFQTRSINKNYEFTLRITDGKDQNLRTFTMFVVSRDSLTADTTDFTADNDVLTADLSPQRTPYITNYPAATTNPTVAAGTIGTFRHDNFFAYQIIGYDCDGDKFEFEIVMGDSADLPPGIVFDRTTGWLTGFFPDQGATETTYNFDITISKLDNNQVVSAPYSYFIKVIGNIENSVTWLNGILIPDRSIDDPIYSLGSINNGDVSTFAIEATNPSGSLLLFKLGTYSLGNQLPQGLSLLESGHIAGRVSFNTFAIDGGTTTFDKDVNTRLNSAETTFDKAFDFTVVAYSSNGLISVSRRFRITVDRAYDSPYQGLYIKAMPDHTDRNFVNSLLQDTDIIQPSRLYRADDPYFGVATDVIYTHAYSLDTATLDEYLLALSKNHFRKKLILGEIKTAQALNTDGTVEYEVVYSNVIDTGVNKLGESPPQSITLPFPATIYSEEATEARELVDENFSNGDLADANVTALNQVSVAYLEEARDLNLLTNVMSQIARDWMGQGQPGDPAPIWDGDKYIPNPKANDTFTPVPSNQCPVNIGEPLRYDKFKSALQALTADDIIWCDYTVTINKDPNGQKLDPPKVVRSVVPFGFLIEVGDTAYITMRGTQTSYDFTLDFMTGKVINPIAGFGKGKTQNGFTMAYKGLGPDPDEVRAADVPGKSLYSVLNDTTKTKIKIGGHSLGSAISTLIANYAQSLNKFNRVEGYVSASPTVGNQVYADYFNALRDKDGNTLGNNFYRLTNKNDLIPTLPGPLLGFIAVAQEVLFDTLYTNSEGKKDIPKNHSICCCYSYALRHPQNPYNNANEAGVENECVFPVGPTNYYVSFDQHVDNLILYYSSFVEQDGTVSQTITTVYPNSLINMRDQVVDVVGQQSTVLPQWMTTKQTDGRVLGFTKAWVIAYTNPGESDRISYNIRSRFGEILNRVNFVSDRYILDNQLTANWVPNADSTDGGNWNPSPPLTTTFDNESSISGLYVSTALIADSSNGAVFDRSLTVNGILVVGAGAVGGQVKVPDEYVKKVGRTFQLIMDKDASNINGTDQQNMIRTLGGAVGTWHAGQPTAQRIGNQAGSTYSPNWLLDGNIASYSGYQEFLDSHVVNDMVWYQTLGVYDGDYNKVIVEVFEHIFHTIHSTGVVGGVQGSLTELNSNSEDNPSTYQGTELFLAMKEVVDSGLYQSGIDINDPAVAQTAMIEYMYLLNWSMWEMSEFWDGATLAPEWADTLRTVAQVQANNPLGYALFNKYFDPVLSKPSFTTLRSIFQENSGGLSGYSAVGGTTTETTFDGNATQFTSPVDIYGKTDKYDKYLVFPKTNILG
jgi:hypothetical protein